MRIAFFGTTNAFGPDEVGGTHSIIRRIAPYLIEQGDTLDYVEYGAEEDSVRDISTGVCQRRFTHFENSLQHLTENYDHVISIYLEAKDRIRYGRFRKSIGNKIRFHHYYTGRHSQFIKNKMLFIDARILPFNGCLFCISTRIKDRVSKWAKRSAILLPAVQNSSFLAVEDKPHSDKIRVLFSGRLDPDKGALQAVEFLRQLATDPKFSIHITGYPMTSQPQSVVLHEKLLKDKNLTYTSVKRDKWTKETDENLQNILRQTDVLLLPYRKLESTIDVPLLLLEGMAHLCAVMTPPLGNMPEIYGNDCFSLDQQWDSAKLKKQIINNAENLERERSRLFQRCKELNFDAESIAGQFRANLLKES